jgi:hypothetical protein
MTQREKVEAIVVRVESGTIGARQAIGLLRGLGPEGRLILDGMARMGFGAAGFTARPA